MGNLELVPQLQSTHAVWQHLQQQQHTETRNMVWYSVNATCPREDCMKEAGCMTGVGYLIRVSRQPNRDRQNLDSYT